MTKRPAPHKNTALYRRRQIITLTLTAAWTLDRFRVTAREDADLLEGELHEFLVDVAGDHLISSESTGPRDVSIVFTPGRSIWVTPPAICELRRAGFTVIVRRMDPPIRPRTAPAPPLRWGSCS